jgi:S1-C subfamily serine protease/pSer/pThr/pTyr-binding forkhead associated (FHA) protein
MPATDIQPPNTLRLKPVDVEGFPRPIDLLGGRLRIGRASDNDVTLPAEHFPSVSQHHCEIVLSGQRLEVLDMGSRNGTLVNGKPVKHALLSTGDVIQLGAIGPRFLVTSSNPLAETMFVDPRQIGVGALTPGELKQALGVPEGVGVEELVRSRTRMHLVRVVILLVLVSTAAVLWGKWIWERGAEDHLQIATLHEQVNEAQTRREEDLARAHASFEQNRTALEAEKHRLEEDRRALQARLGKLEDEGNTSADELGNLRGELDTTRGQLENALEELRLYNPVDLEQARLGEVARVRTAIVLLEAITTIEDAETGKTLYLTEEDGRSVPNFEDRGQPVEFESTGSGFCVSPEGWILTNAHVVLPMEDEPLITGAAGLPVRSKVRLNAVFSGTDRRRPVQVVSIAHENEEDLALLRIEPFDGMPFIEGFDPDAKMPDPGEDVYLFGFPLGNFALQQGNTVIASTFRGIVSRLVDGKLQVDAGVHPGNSGGPVTDSNGHIIGVVTSVQALPDQSAVYTIGYALPITDAKKLWPPPRQ